MTFLICLAIKSQRQNYKQNKMKQQQQKKEFRDDVKIYISLKDEGIYRYPKSGIACCRVAWTFFSYAIPYISKFEKNFKEGLNYF